MGTSYTEYKENGFWSKDGLLAGVLYLISRELLDKHPNDNFICEIAKELHEAATDGYIGCIPNHLDKFDNSEKLTQLRQATINVIAGLQTDSYLTIADLNENEIDGAANWTAVNRLGFEGTAKLLLQLIDGNLKTNASSEINYWTFLE